MHGFRRCGQCDHCLSIYYRICPSDMISLMLKPGRCPSLIPVYWAGSELERLHGVAVCKIAVRQVEALHYDNN